LSRRKRIDWRSLGEQRYVDFNTDWGSRQVTDRAFAAAGVARHIASEVNDVHTLIDMVVHGLGVAIVPEHITRKKTAAKLVSLPLPADAPHWEVMIALPATSTAAGETFLAPIRKRLGALPHQRAISA
jgi:DNA-binding transcriptional LysR family regulator